MKISAMSKVNLGLDVIRRRDDGYHEVRMIMQTLKLCDELYIEETSTSDIRISCNNETLECDENNLIYKAAKLIMDEAKICRGLDIRLIKNMIDNDMITNAVFIFLRTSSENGDSLFIMLVNILLKIAATTIVMKPLPAASMSTSPEAVP